MTKGEIERLAVVETKIDDMSDGQVTLKEFLITKIDALEESMNITMLGQKEAIGIAMIASEKAIVKAEMANDLRFNDMGKRFNDTIETININIKTLTDNQSLNTGIKTGTTESKVDLTRYLGWIVSILSIGAVLVTLFIR